MKPLRSLKFSSKNLCLTWLRKNLVPIFFWKNVEPYIGPGAMWTLDPRAGNGSQPCIATSCRRAWKSDWVTGRGTKHSLSIQRLFAGITRVHMRSTNCQRSSNSEPTRGRAPSDVHECH